MEFLPDPELCKHPNTAMLWVLSCPTWPGLGKITPYLWQVSRKLDKGQVCFWETSPASIYTWMLIYLPCKSVEEVLQ